MTASELLDDVKAVLRQHDHDADDLRELAGRFERLANKYDAQDDVF